MKSKNNCLSYIKRAETAKESQRHHAILLVKTDSTISYVARLFYVDEETIRAWVELKKFVI